MSAHPLTLRGADVALRHRRADGRVVVDFVDRAGQRLGHSDAVWPHELRGLGWHIAAVKRAVAVLPLEGAPAPAEARPDSGNRLFAHFAIAKGDR